jgi:endonuclease G
MAEHSAVLEDIRSLVSQNEVELALEQLTNLLRGTGSNLYNEALLHTSRLLEIRRRERRGQLSPNDALLEVQRLRFDILDFLDDVARQLQRVPAPMAKQPVSFKPPEEAGLEKIFGVNHLKHIAWLQQGLEAAKSVCRVITPTSVGTGFVIEGGTLLTNYHVIPNAAVAEGSHVEFNYEEDLSRTLKPSYHYRLRASTLRENRTFDYALVQIEADSRQPPLSTWGYLPLEAEDKPEIGEHVTIIQHPDGGPKQIGLTANQVVNIFDYRLQYTTDTLPGSSGSPVFNDAWKVIALHHAGGNLLTNQRGDRMFANEGILVGYILEHLKP